MPKEVDAITKLYVYLLWMIPKLDKYPRSQKFLLADRIEALMLDILEPKQETAPPGLVAFFCERPGGALLSWKSKL